MDKTRFYLKQQLFIPQGFYRGYIGKVLEYRKNAETGKFEYAINILGVTFKPGQEWFEEHDLQTLNWYNSFMVRKE